MSRSCRRSPRLLLALACALGFQGCLLPACSAPPRGPPEFRDADYPGLLRSPALLVEDVLLQQQVTARWGEGDRGGERGFDAALQKQGDMLTLVGLSPLGSAGFVITYDCSRGDGSGDGTGDGTGDDGRLEFRNELGDEWPFPPRFILVDVQRVFWPWLEPTADGRHEGIVGDERVVEIVVDGRLLERRFERLDDQPAGTIRVLYTWAADDGRYPSLAELDNGWFGYRLRIETTSVTPLAGAAPSGTSAAPPSAGSRQT